MKILVLGALVLTLLLAGIPSTLAADNQGKGDLLVPSINCLNCHVDKENILKHDSLGEGYKSCISCHDDNYMDMLSFSNDNLLPLEKSTRLCGQCHETRYDLWKRGIHGEATRSSDSGPGCTQCHDPHKPFISGIETKQPKPRRPQASNLSLLKFLPVGSIIGVGILSLIFIRYRNSEAKSWTGENS